MTGDVGRILGFLVELDKLKAVLRRTRPSAFERYENSAEHSWHVCVAAWSLAGHAREPVDVTRAIEMLLVHDIPEIDCGDHFAYTRGAAVAEAELQAARRIFGLLPEPQSSLFLARWEEFEARQSREAVYAYAIDRLLPVLHNLENAGQAWRDHAVPLDQVLAFNAAIGQALPGVWEEVKERITKLGDKVWRQPS
jgi:putative hydrolases of HD superfamily